MWCHLTGILAFPFPLFVEYCNKIALLNLKITGIIEIIIYTQRKLGQDKLKALMDHLHW
jgi:hypothetical protein